MSSSSLVLQERDYLRIRAILAQLRQDLHAHLVLLINRSGQNIVSEGLTEGIDLTALASLAAANVAATGGLAQTVGETDFPILLHQGQRRSLHISELMQEFCIVLLFDRSLALGLVRWKVKCATALLEEQLLDRKLKSRQALEGPDPGRSFRHFTDEEIRRLFEEL